MENKQGKSKSKIIIALLAVLLLGSGAYIFKMTNDNKKQVTELTNEKTAIENDLQQRIAALDELSNENTILKEDIETKKEEMEQLLNEIKNAKTTISSLAKYKASYFQLKKDMDNLVVENEALKAKNLELTTSLDSTNVALEDARKFTDTLLHQNNNLTQKVAKGSQLSIVNLQTQAVKERRSGKQIVTDKASRANKLKISFTIAKNKIATTGDKTYYVQIIDSNNNVLGEKNTISLKDKTLTYSFTTTIAYKNKTVQVNEEITNDNFESGTYFVHVFNPAGEMVSNTEFSLR